jgi:hypothetical protein
MIFHLPTTGTASFTRNAPKLPDATLSSISPPGRFEPNLPGTSLRLGRPAGSAVPLVWAHAEYLKLLEVFDRIDPVYARCCRPRPSGHG